MKRIAPHTIGTCLCLLAMSCTVGEVDVAASSGSITGTMLVEGDDEQRPLPNATVYIDQDGDGALSEEEPRTTTDAMGRFELEDIEAGEHDVRAAVPFGFRGKEDLASQGQKTKGVSSIVGGVDANVQDFAFAVGIGSIDDNDQFSFFCGGALITDRHVLTAAHCSIVTADLAGVKVGSTNRDDPSSGTVFRVARVDIHPAWDEVEAANDMAVWTLAEPINPLSQPFRTVALLTEENQELAQAGTLASVVGWGIANQPTPILQQAHVPIVDIAECSSRWNATNFDAHVCAAYLDEGGVDTCNGDSGGPLLIRNPASDEWVHAGATSFGAECGSSSLPGVYASTIALGSWVREIARESDVAALATVSSGEETEITLSVVDIRRPDKRPIGPRIQLRSVSVPAGVNADSDFDISFAISSDALVETSCLVDIDGGGPLAETAVPCASGEVSTATMPGLPAGIYMPSVSAEAGGSVTVASADFQIGEPAVVENAGELTAGDLTDADYQQPFLIDYFDVTGLSASKAIAIGVDATFDSFVAVYDADIRTPQGGGALFAGQAAANEENRMVFFPEPGRRYRIGVSTAAPNANGAYSVRLVNEGSLAPTPL